jgi:chromate transporter
MFPSGVALRRLDAVSLGWAILSFVLLQRSKINVIHLIMLSVGFGLIRYLFSL